MTNDLRLLFRRTRLIKLVLLYPLFLSGVLLASWPTGYTWVQSTHENPLRYWAYAFAFLLGKAVLATAAHLDNHEEEDLLPGDWVRYAAAPVPAVLGGKLLSGLATTLFWALISLPTLVMAKELARATFSLTYFYLYWVFLGASLTVWGVWSTLIITHRESRNVTLSGLWLGLLFLPLLPWATPDTWVSAVVHSSPLHVVRRLTLPAAEQANATPFGTSMLLQALILLAGLVAAWMELRRWQARDGLMPGD